MRGLAPFLLAGIVLGACTGPATGPSGADYRDLPADQVLIGVTYNPTTEGIRSAIGNFDTVFVFTDSSSYHVRGVNLRIFDVDGRQTATVTSETGVLNQATDALIGRGNVVLVTQNNCRITTEELHYDPATRRVWSDVRTRFEFGGSVTTADQFRADDQFTNVQAQGLRGQIPSQC